jgi:hypothetical protein
LIVEVATESTQAVIERPRINGKTNPNQTKRVLEEIRVGGPRQREWGE